MSHLERGDSTIHEFPDPESAGNVTYNPTYEQLRSFSADQEVTTEYGNPAYVTRVRSRSAGRTKNRVDDTFAAADWKLLRTARRTAADRELVCLDRRMGRHPDNSYVCRLYVPAEHARIALAWAKLFEPVAADGPVAEPDFVTLQLPDFEETAIRVFPEAGVTYVLGSDYTGEAKKSFLRLFMYRAKQQGGLGLHAGSKRVTIEDRNADEGRSESEGRTDRDRSGSEDRDADGDLREVGQLFLGLSATGKSTLTSHGCWLESPEEAVMLQDDVCALLPDGTVAGSEGNGLFIKTDGLSADEQPELHRAGTHESAVLENVAVDDDGTVDFDDDSITANGRAVVLREHLDSADDEIDLDSVDQVFFITRNPLMAPISRLSAEQAAAAFVLGESIETSAGDPERAGESIRVVGTNPFIIGSKGQEGNRFFDLIDDLDVESYLINTGKLGEDGKDVGVEESVTLLTEVARGEVEWTHDETLGLDIPASVPGMDVDVCYPPDYHYDYESALAELRAERAQYLDGFEELREEISRAVY
jgi:phosphoenolpyruvate carboxykinase (ATP)